MARYSRDFLVPYLSNICALHLAENRLWKWYYQVMDRQLSLQYSFDKPALPDYQQPMGCGTVMLSLMASFFLMSGIIAVTNEGGLAIGVILLIIAGICTFTIVRSVRKVNAENQRLEKKYKAALDTYEIRCKNNESRTDRMKKQMDSYKREIDRIDSVLKKMYSANVIPSNYRDSYVAVYLYDWFSTSGADDLDHALNMYVLEEIKSRLETIIENQSSMILNQKVMMANQMRSIEERNRHENMMRAKLDRIQATSEERLRYTRMIEANTSAMAFFATANYLRDL